MAVGPWEEFKLSYYDLASSHLVNPLELVNFVVGKVIVRL